MNLHPDSKPLGAPARRNLLKVLLVDDDPLQHDILAETLRSLGVLGVTFASSGAQALQKLGPKADAFQLVLLDLHMPGMDGFQFMESLAKAGYTGALIIVSGQSDDVLHAATLVARLRRFSLLGAIPKPVDRGSLSGLLSAMG
ncbi:MAG: response regulator [Rhodoferax sp.]|nr:response regulator [Rhodoferax sp.]